ncbi:PLP-dependent transferase [Flavobacterium crassostreae]|uniref:Cystathionine beta-synthase n=1 Tax=Flavobacterium crassostreae TaxID=1763534 RepID=A0A1B9E9Y3_9FLAO|nr:PLP-dependent transferase [Flavobacterium crassostreae]OCB78764.1 cystathionine beta-synthase [Flavobacterium crassostreae]
MKDTKMLQYITEVINNMPTPWLDLTTHRLDIYNENQAKTQFLTQFTTLFNNPPKDLTTALQQLPTAYDYIRLGHPLSCVLEWAIAKIHHIPAENVISFSSLTIPILAVLRKNVFDHKKTQLVYTNKLPDFLDQELIKNIYGYCFDIKKIAPQDPIPAFDGSTIFISEQAPFEPNAIAAGVDFFISLQAPLGSVLIVNGAQNQDYIAAIQHVRRRESIAMTPQNCLIALQSLVGQRISIPKSTLQQDQEIVLNCIQEITHTTTKPLVASSGLSIQYAILMGLIHDAVQNHNHKKIKIIVPPNCYGGTNDQARRVAATLPNVEIVDLLVDGANNMVQSIARVLTQIALEDAIPYIIAEIPTNPRVEVPDLIELKTVLSQERHTESGSIAVAPVFILDQTFCPNVPFLAPDGLLTSVQTISFASGSKFPSGGQCTAGYCVGNEQTDGFMQKIALHLALCDNEATELQYQILAKQLPSMNQRIAAAYANTRDFVTFIQTALPEAKINFVSEELAQQGFTPSVFSLDLPTKGATAQEKENYKRDLNLQLINLMIQEIPNESKFCVSYGQLKGCYWTIPATSTQGTTKEDDKDYIVRVSLSANMDLERHKKVFSNFVATI